MKILQIIYGLSSGGAERFLVDLCNELANKQNCNVTILMIKSQSPENTFYLKELNEKVVVKNLDFKSIDFTIFGTLYKAIRYEKPDIAHIHLSPIILFCIKSLLFYRKPVYIETLHNEVARIDNSSKIKRLLKHIVYRTNMVKICTISDKNAREFKRVYGRDCDALTRIAGRVDHLVK